MTNYNELRDGQEFYGNGYKQGYKQGYEDAKKEFERLQGEQIRKVDDMGFVLYICIVLIISFVLMIAVQI